MMLCFFYRVKLILFVWDSEFGIDLIVSKIVEMINSGEVKGLE